MSSATQMAEGFAALRGQCDPRGHALLEALAELCLYEAVCLDAVLKAAKPETHSNVVSRIDRYSMKVPCA